MLNLAALTAGLDRPQGHGGGDVPPLRLHDDLHRGCHPRALDEGQGRAAGRDLRGPRRLGPRVPAAVDRAPPAAWPAPRRRRPRAGEVPKDVLTTLLRRTPTSSCRTRSSAGRSPSSCWPGRTRARPPSRARCTTCSAGATAHPEDGGADAHRPPVPAALRPRDVAAVTVQPDQSAPGRAAVTLKGSGVQIPAGETVVIDLTAINRDTELFGADAGGVQPAPRAAARDRRRGGCPSAAACTSASGRTWPRACCRTGRWPTTTSSGWSRSRCRRCWTTASRRDPDDRAEMDTTTKRPYWGRYPVVFAA